MGTRTPTPIPARLALRQSILSPLQRILLSLPREGASLRPRAAGLSNTAVATRQRLHYQPPAFLPCPQGHGRDRPGPTPAHGLWRLRKVDPQGCTRGASKGLKGGAQQAMWPLPASLVSQLWRLEAALGHEHQGPVETTSQRSRVTGFLEVEPGASVLLTSWDAGGREAAAAPPARWR